MIEGLRTVIYPVFDVVEASAWYRKVLGVEPYFADAFYVGFSVGGFELGLVPGGVPGNAGAIAYWGTGDIAAELARLLELGAVLELPVKEVGMGISVASVKDPFGNVLGIIDNPNFDRGKVA
jgi:predicted enzyme related to lactoylglutathione lyase